MNRVNDKLSYRVTLDGRVQGVGFRPFVYCLAVKLSLTGWVKNTSGKVDILIQGSESNIQQFKHQLISDAPDLALPEIYAFELIEQDLLPDFEIIASDSSAQADIHLPPDLAMCSSCHAEFHAVDNRRFHYPFINCTQCGPRYTIIRALPYDREQTSMQHFQQCDNCLDEYTRADNRRFHAEPNACSECGPELVFELHGEIMAGDSQSLLQHSVAALKQGKLLAVKSVGGFHLICDAANDAAVLRLRENKYRPDKPLALMLPAKGKDGLDAVRSLVLLENTKVEKALLSARRPILLLPKCGNLTASQSSVSQYIAPGLNEIGVMLPPSPLHECLTQLFGSALVATSGNISGEPVMTDNDEAKQRLGPFVDGLLMHNRDIVRPADDSVLRYMAQSARPIRLGRGLAPVEMALPVELPEAVLAVGGHMKNTLCLAWGHRVVISPHIGDLSAYRSQQVFAQVAKDLQRLYQVKAERLVCDFHSQYSSSQWAAEQNLPISKVQHHIAHASALAGDNQLTQKTGLVFCWDGVGLGLDDNLWGGEVFLGKPGDWKRIATFKPFRLVGGDKVSLQPWRSAAALCWEMGLDYEHPQADVLKIAWEKQINSIQTHAVGRLFDAAAALTDLLDTATFDGQAPMLLESIAQQVDTEDCLDWDNTGKLIEFDWQPLVEKMTANRYSVAYKAGYFHRILANTLVAFAQETAARQTLDYVGLSGGVFQNRLLTESVQALLQKQNVNCAIAQQIPMNDGGISYGQVVEYACGLE